MNHCYILDYCTGEIYHCEVPNINCTDDILKIYIKNHYGYDLHKDTFHMIVNEHINIKEL